METSNEFSCSPNEGETMKASEVLEAIESYVDDDFAEVISCELGFGRMRGRSAEMARRLMAIYMIAHSFQERHSCFGVHSNERKRARERLDAIRKERISSPAASNPQDATEIDAARK
jgi:hypothetical protein